MSSNPPRAKRIAGPMSKFVTQNVENTLQVVIARMVARDGIPFRLFITSPDIRKGLNAQGFSTVPKSQETIKTMVKDHGMVIKEIVCREMRQLKISGKRLSHIR